MRFARSVLVVAAVAGSLSLVSDRVSAAECAPSSTAEGLNEFFGGDDAAGLAGADYPHAIDLPDGRTLWYFQDAFTGSGGELRGEGFAHNAALVQTGDCFEMLEPPGGDGDSWIGSWVETDLRNWLWPLDAEVGADGNLWLFLAEVQNPNASGAARGALPVGTWIARYSLPELRLIGMDPAPDASRSLFGYSIVSDSEWSYLYGHCYRQFDEAGLIGFDSDCSPHAYVARVPAGQFDRELEYWTSDGWSGDRAARTPVLTSELSMPPSVQRFGDVYVAASVEGDWFGDDVVAYTSPAPQGPWTEAMRYTPETRCGDDCNNYGAFVLPDLEGDRVVIALSNNAKDMRRAFADASLYRVGVRAVDVPGISASNMSRSPDLELARAEPAVPEPAVTVPVPDATTFVGGRGQQTGRWVIPPSASVAVPALTDAGGTDPGVLTSVVAALLVFGTAAVLPVAGLTFVRSTRRTRFRRGHVLDRLHGAAPGRTHHPPGRRAPDPTPPTP